MKEISSRYFLLQLSHHFFVDADNLSEIRTRIYADQVYICYWKY